MEDCRRFRLKCDYWVLKAGEVVEMFDTYDPVYVPVGKYGPELDHLTVESNTDVFERV